MAVGIYKVAFGFWNNFMDISMNLFKQSSSSNVGGIYGMASALFSSISGISIPIAIIFFLIAIIRDVVTTPPDQQVRKFFSDAVKFAVVVGIVTNLWFVMGKVMEIADGITSAMAGGTTSYHIEINESDTTDPFVAAIKEVEEYPTPTIAPATLAADIMNALKEWGDWLLGQILLFIGGVVALIVIVASSISILSSAIQRIIKPMLILPFSAIAVAFASGTGEASQVTSRYMKTFFGFCLSGAFYVVCIKFGTAVVTSIAMPALYGSLTASGKAIYFSVQNAVVPIVIAGLVKSVDSIISRFL